MNNRRASLVTAVAVWEIVIAAGIVLFWVSFFTVKPVDIGDPGLKETYLAFESAFPIADFALVCALVLAAAGLLKGREGGRTFTLMAGGMLIFLGLLDVSFNSLQGIYRVGTAEALLNGAINVVSLGSGLFFAVWAARRRRGDREARRGEENRSHPKLRERTIIRCSWDRSRP